jgi:2-polyprenyl-3-methyl-5-hydroxy-6-metoxy-1,4-benzoquinol methylase
MKGECEVRQKEELAAMAATIIENVIGFKMNNEEIKTYEHGITERWEDGDYSEKFYEDPEYPWLALSFWADWSYANTRRTIQFMDSIKYQSTKILDIGAGVGLTTIQLAKQYPNTTVIYQNIPSLQDDVARELFKELGTGNVICSTSISHDADVVIGFEVFEHIQRPTEVAAIALRHANIYSDSSSFGFPSPGHWPMYYDQDGRLVGRDKMKRSFYSFLSGMSFGQAHKLGLIAKPFWNGRPAVWVREGWLEEMVSNET